MCIYYIYSYILITLHNFIFNNDHAYIRSKKPSHKSWVFCNPGSEVLSRFPAESVSSPLRRLTTVFGMETSRSTSLEPPGVQLYKIILYLSTLTFSFRPIYLFGSRRNTWFFLRQDLESGVLSYHILYTELFLYLKVLWFY